MIMFFSSVADKKLCKKFVLAQAKWQSKPKFTYMFCIKLFVRNLTQDHFVVFCREEKVL